METEQNPMLRVGLVLGLIGLAGGAMLVFSLLRPTVDVNMDIGNPAKGPEDAPVVIREYSDFQCPFCRTAAASLSQAVQEFSGKVRVVYNYFPLPSHVHAREAALSATCAAAQGKFWEYHDVLFGKQSEWATLGDVVPTFRQYLTDAGGDAAAYDACVAKRDMVQIETDLAEGQKLDVQGTPTFYINGGRAVNLSKVEEWRAAIQSELDKKK